MILLVGGKMNHSDNSQKASQSKSQLSQNFTTRVIVTQDPEFLDPLNEYEQMDYELCQKYAMDSFQAFTRWKESSFSERKMVMLQVANNLKSSRERLSLLMTFEMGKPIAQARSEIDKCISVCEYYAENAEAFLQNEEVSTEAKKSFICYQPLGPILAVMPWNFPFWQVFRFAAPALMAGNTVLLKHASNVSGCSIEIEKLFANPSIPKGLFKSLITNSDTAVSLIDLKEIAAVTLTGSTQAGKSIASAAGKNLKKCVLELGGSDPYIILEDADLEKAAEICAHSRLINSGQSCIAAKRFIVVESVAAKFEELFLKKLKAYRLGSPKDPQTQVGPMARVDLRDELHNQVTKSQTLGAKLLTGGEIPKNRGAFYPVTLLTDVKPGMPAFDEELFGPVAAVIRAKDEKEAIKLANQSVYGLGAAIFSKNIQKATEFATFEVQAGSCFVNEFVRSDPRLPFGGIKESGYGRELSALGIKEFTNIKTIWVA